MLKGLRKPGSVAVLIIAAAALFAAAACSDDDDAGAQDNGSDLEARVQRVEVLSALTVLGDTGLHDIDEELQEADEIPEGVSSDIERARGVASSTEWPEPLAEHADTLIETMDDFIAALEAEELQESKGLATDTHDVWHDMEHDAWAWVAGEEIEEHDEEEEGNGESEDAGEESPSS